MEEANQEIGTKDRIIYESLKLFATNGYDAVSTRMIARAINASDTVIYKHFSNKREIMDTIVEVCKEKFLKQRQSVDMSKMNPDKLIDVCMDMFHFQTTDEWIVLFRRLIVVEQFRDPKMSQLYKSFFIDIAMDEMVRYFTIAVEWGYLKPLNLRVLAKELYAPFFMYHTFPTEDPEEIAELREHVTYFMQNYSTGKKP